jgi:hypothetical protein
VSFRASGTIRAEHPGDVGVDLAHLGIYRCRQSDRRRVRAAAAERGHVPAGGDALKAGHQNDQILGQGLTDALGADVDDPGLGVRGVGDDPGLGTGQRDRPVTQVVDRHRAQRARDPLARGEEHVQLAAVGIGRDLLGHGDQLVGGLAPRGEHGHDSLAGFALPHDPASGMLDPLGIGDRGAAELHHHCLGHGLQG